MTTSAGCEDRACIRLAEDHFERCGVEIHPEVSASGSVHLIARVKGIPPFQYHWSTGDTTQTIRLDSVKGEICVKIRDRDGCEASDCIDLGELDCRVEIVRRNSGLTAVVKGVGPFRYLWNTGETTQTIMPSDSGEYCVTVTNYFGCEAKDCTKWAGPRCGVKIVPQRVDQPGIIVLIARLQNDHATSVSPVRFHWSTGDSTQKIEIDGPGRYCVKIQTPSGCTAEDCIEAPPEWFYDCGVQIEVTLTDNGEALLKAIPRGREPFKFEWTNGTTKP